MGARDAIVVVLVHRAEGKTKTVVQRHRRTTRASNNGRWMHGMGVCIIASVCVVYQLASAEGLLCRPREARKQCAAARRAVLIVADWQVAAACSLLQKEEDT